MVGLCVAALAAIAALVTGSFGDTHARIIGSSLGFSCFCALGASGDTLRTQTTGALSTAGAVAAALAGLAFALLVAAVWLPGDEEWLWQTWGVAAVTALWASHWSLVLRARRRTDTPAIRRTWQASIVTATIDMLAGNAAIAGLVDGISEGFVRALGVVLVLTVLTTAAPPIMRRLVAPREPGLARQLRAAAERVERIRSPEDARREAEALRRLAERT